MLWSTGPSFMVNMGLREWGVWARKAAKWLRNNSYITWLDNAKSRTGFTKLPRFILIILPYCSVGPNNLNTELDLSSLGVIWKRVVAEFSGQEHWVWRRNLLSSPHELVRSKTGFSICTYILQRVGCRGTRTSPLWIPMIEKPNGHG